MSGSSDDATSEELPAQIVVGPLLRYVDSEAATVWVETDRACTVRVEVADPAGGARTSVSEPTWGVRGHHYALVVLQGLAPGTAAPYTVSLDGTRAWPPPDSPFPPSVIATLPDPADGDGTVRIAFGSCRRAAPTDAAGLAEYGADALAALAARLAAAEGSRPDALLLCGDQVYADEPSEAMLERLRAAHDARAAAEVGDPQRDDRAEVRDEVQTFEEYSWLYQESWTAPDVRWLLSTVPTCMILDDHDLRDDWNSSWTWRQETSAKPWWRERVLGAFSSYWVYQHLGNLSPRELAEDPLYRDVREAADDAVRAKLLEAFAWRADSDPDSARWSYYRDIGSTRLLVVDSRCSRHLEPDHRAMVDATEWQWLVEHADADVEHLLIGTTLPLLLLPGIHHLEGWNEATARGAWGRLYAKVAERVRQAVDLEHWSAFRRSFDAMVELISGVAARERPPASVLVLSGDVHCSYLAEARTPAVDRSRTRVHQLVMSPFRNELESSIKAMNRLLKTRPAVAVCKALARRAGVSDPDVEWQVDAGPWFDNGIMTVTLSGRTARVDVDAAYVDESGRQRLRRRHAARLA